MNKEVLTYKNLRILEVGKDYLIGAKGYSIYRLDKNEKKWRYFSRIKDCRYSLLSRFRMLSRLFRAEVHFYKTLRNGQAICIAKKGIFAKNSESGLFEKCFDIVRGTRPLNLCEDYEGNIFFGEYFHNPERDSVNIYRSKNSGADWEIAYTFPGHSIRHIHGLHFDQFANAIWLTTGDLDGECMIANTTDNFRTLNIVYKGGQEYRACNLLFYRDKIIYGTDTETAQNYLKQIDRESLEIKDLAVLQGSVINAVKVGEKCFVNTTVEPSKVNKDNNSYIWMYNDETKDCSIIAQYEKDFWDHRYFQFGSCRFPEYADADSPYLYFFGNALKKIDGDSMKLDIKNISILK